MLCDVWYDVFYPVGVDSGLFYAGNGGSNPARLDDLCDFFESCSRMALISRSGIN